MLFSSTHQQYLDKWSLPKPHKKLETFSSYLYWVKIQNNTAVLKIYKSHSDEAASAKLLQHYTEGAVSLIQFDDNACLLEQVGTGRELVELTRAEDDSQATSIFCDVVKKLHKAPKVDIGLKPVDDFIVDFDQCLAEKPVNDRGLIEQARQIYADLSASQNAKVNLHGDLHHYNIMQATNGDWLAIDPKGLWGEAEYEIGRYLINPLVDDYKNINLDQRLEIIEQQLGYDMQRVKGWAFSQLILALIWADAQNDFKQHAQKLVSQFHKLV